MGQPDLGPLTLPFDLEMQNKSQKVRIYFVRAQDIKGMAETLRPFLEPALEALGNYYSSDDILYEGSRDQISFYLAAEEESGHILGLVTLRAVSFPQKNVMYVLTMGGREGSRWITPMIMMLEQIKKDLEFDSIEATITPGMLRLLRKHGFTTFQTFLGMEA